LGIGHSSHSKVDRKRWVANVRTKERDSISPVSRGGTPGSASVLAAVTDEASHPTPVHVRLALQSIHFYPSFALGGRLESLASRAVEHTPRIASSGEDLLTALHTMSQEVPATWEELLSDLRAVFPWCGQIRFPAAPGRGQVMLSWVDSRSGATMFLHEMSEGMRVYLALIAALHAGDTPELLAFDEPERSLHPYALARLVKVVESRAEHVPVIVATHADQLLDYSRRTWSAGSACDPSSPRIRSGWDPPGHRPPR
jgi:predicted ATPase